MSLIRGTAFTTLAWMVTMGCGSSESPANPDSGTNPNVDAPAPEPTPVNGIPVDGVFVSSSKGSDDADGTTNRPVKTLARALQLAVEKRNLPVIACSETFTEAVTLPAGVSMFGYHDCSNQWKRTAQRATIQSPTSPAVLADGLTLPTRIEGFELIAPSMTGAVADGAVAASSYGMIVKATANLTIAELSILGGNGQDGVDGVEPTTTNGWVTPASAPGSVATGITAQSCFKVGPNQTICNFYAADQPMEGSAAGSSACTSGAAGGTGGKGGGGRTSDNFAYTTSAYQASWSYGNPATATAETAKHNGNGADGARGAFGTNGAWSMTAAGFVPADGTPGGIGAPGQGGGGGDGRGEYGEWDANNVKTLSYSQLPPNLSRTGVGGGGGAGGCGGIPGTGGRGGGASIGLVVIDSNVSISTSTIGAQNGGRGGKGATGNGGTPGANGGSRSSASAGFPGGKGGSGGAGGQSGHGSVGPSIALGFHGTRPTTTDVELKPGQAGEGGSAVVDESQTLPTAERIAVEEYSF